MELTFIQILNYIYLMIYLNKTYQKDSLF